MSNKVLVNFRLILGKVLYVLDCVLCILVLLLCVLDAIYYFNIASNTGSNTIQFNSGKFKSYVTDGLLYEKESIKATYFDTTEQSIDIEYKNIVIVSGIDSSFVSSVEDTNYLIVPMSIAIESGLVSIYTNIKLYIYSALLSIVILIISQIRKRKTKILYVFCTIQVLAPIISIVLGKIILFTETI